MDIQCFRADTYNNDHIIDYSREVLMKKIYGGVLFLALGVGAFILLGVSVTNAKKTQTWPETTGVVLQSLTRDNRKSGTSTARIFYEYTVDGNKYTSNAIRAFGILGFH